MKLSVIFEELSSKQIELILQKSPQFFNNKQRFALGIKHGVYDFVLEMDIDEIDSYIDGDRVIRRWKDKNGQERKETLFKNLMDGDISDIYEYHSYDGDWESALDYHINEENEKRIEAIINKQISDSGKDPDDYSDHTLQDKINEFGDDVISEIRSTLYQMESDEYSEFLRNELEEACEKLGEIKMFSWEGVKIKINIKDFFTEIFGKDFTDDEELIEIMDERCEWDIKCAYNEIYHEYADKPRFDPDERWYPDIDFDYFNDTLSDRLGELE